MADLRHAVAVSSLLCMPVQLSAEDLPDFDFKYWTLGEELETYRRNLYAAHQQCNGTALHRRLSGGEIQICGDVFLELKLSFLKGVTRERYNDMRPKTRAVAHDKAYAAYRAWLHRQITPTGSMPVMME